jgi:hypothetical protein
LRKLTALLFLLTIVPLAGEPSASEKYRLHYGVEWRMVRAGVAQVSWAPSGDGYQADLHLESAGLVNKLYRVNDDYRSQMSSGTCANSVLFHAEEGKRRRETTITFDRHAGKVNYHERDLLKNNTVLSKELQVPPCTYEYLGALHHLRELKLAPGQSTTVPMTDGKKFAQVKVEAQEREQVKTPLGTFSTVRYEIHMFNDVILTRKARMYLWLTDDARKLPVQLRLRMQFLIGTITLQLEKEEKL